MMPRQLLGSSLLPKGSVCVKSKPAMLPREQVCYCSAWKGISHPNAPKFQQRIPMGG